MVKFIRLSLVGLLVAQAGLHAMRHEDVSEDGCSVAPKILRPRSDGRAPAPQLRKRVVNEAQQNNCGNIAVKVSLHAPFADGVHTLLNATKIKGNKVDPKDQYLNLFSFNVPITDELVATMPRSVRLNGSARSLRPEDKKMLADHIKEVTVALVNREREKVVFMFDVEEVIAQDGTATAYFVPGPDLGGFVNAMTAIHKELKKNYRWGRPLKDGGNDLKDGVWFDFVDVNTIRPSMKIVSSKNGRGSKIQRISGRNRLSDKRTSSETSLIHASPDEAARQVSLSSRSSNSLTVDRISEKAPSRSPERSPRTSGEEASLKSYTDTYWGDAVRTLDVTGNTLRIEIEVVETQAGNC